MNKRKFQQHAVSVFVIFVLLFGVTGYKNDVYAASGTITNVLKQGMRNDDVVLLQERLKELNFFNASVTGYFGDITQKSVISFQKSKGIAVDGIVGVQTLNAFSNQQQKRPVKTALASRGDIDRQKALVPWFDGVENIFKRGTNAVVTDVDTGITFEVKRTGGTNHSDTETLSNEYTALLKKIYGGEWSWERRAVIVTIGNQKIAASMTGMPHAGRDDKPAGEVVSDRSGGYGTGINYDSIKGNGMIGHFDIHFLGSRTHRTNKIDEQHQVMVMKAARSINY